ncbi:leucine-rich repeat, cysteine-containing subtype protein [Tanacetum coccineum]
MRPHHYYINQRSDLKALTSGARGPKRCLNLEVLYTEDECGDKGLQVIAMYCKKLRKLTHNGVVTHVGLIASCKARMEQVEKEIFWCCFLGKLANLNKIHHRPDSLCTTQTNEPKGDIVVNYIISNCGLNGERLNVSDCKSDSGNNQVNSSLNNSISDNEILADFIAKQKGKLASNRRKPSSTRPFRSIKLKDVIHREDQFKKKYPHLFTKTTPSSSAAS